MPFFSVIIPLYNKVNFIQQTLRSVLAQSFSDFEIVVVNDGSTDGSTAKVEELDSGKIKLVNQKNQGASLARNKGIEKANGNYIALLDADDYWYPGHLQNLMNLIENFPKAGLFCAEYEIELHDKRLRKAVHGFQTEQPQLVGDYFESSLINAVAWTSAVAFSKETFFEVGQFDPELRTGQDIDFFIRVALKERVAFSPKTTMRYHKKSENNLAQSQFNGDRLRLIEKYETEEKTNPSLKKYLDINRYALVVRCKIAGDPLWKKAIGKITPQNLTPKQKLLLKMPSSLLKLAKTTQRLLMRFNIYVTAFR